MCPLTVINGSTSFYSLIQSYAMWPEEQKTQRFDAVIMIYTYFSFKMGGRI